MKCKINIGIVWRSDIINYIKTNVGLEVLYVGKFNSIFGVALLRYYYGR